MSYIEAGPWRIDRRFSVAVVLTFLCQIATAVWFASKTDSRIQTLEERYLALAEQTAQDREFQINQRIRVWERVNDLGEAQNAFRADIAGIDARLEYITRSLDRLTTLADRRRAEPPKAD